MKNKQRKQKESWKKDQNAVSPVIAVILMVAITVVLAATVFVLVSDISQHTATVGPAVSFQEEKAKGNLTVTQAPEGLNWSDFDIDGCSALPTGQVEAGDKLSGCDGEVSIRHKPSNSLTYKGTF